jgi:high-affinity K+ transport system ATPase subunit B
LKIGDVVLAEAGDMIPSDGEVRCRRSVSAQHPTSLSGA